MIFLDSWVLLEFVFHGPRFKKAKKLLENIKSGKIKGLINSIVLAELKYQVEKRLEKEKAEEIIFLIENFPNLEIVEVNKEIAKLGANLRVKYYKKPERMVSYADMINLATAIIKKCKVFYTGDPEFRNVEEIKVKIL